MAKPRPRLLSTLVGVTLLLSACSVGTQFTRPPEGYVRLGETTRAQIQERLGKPSDETSVRHDNVLAKGIQYTYASDAEAAKVANTACIRSIAFMLVDDRVVGELFLSACASDHTDFDERQGDRIVKGQTTCDEIVAMLGRPAYRAIYPLAKEKGNLVIGYEFQYVKRPLLQFKMYDKDLTVECDASGVVRDLSFTESGDR